MELKDLLDRLSLRELVDGVGSERRTGRKLTVVGAALATLALGAGAPPAAATASPVEAGFRLEPAPADGTDGERSDGASGLRCEKKKAKKAPEGASGGPDPRDDAK